MSRAALTFGLALVLGAAPIEALRASRLNPHLDPGIVLAGCPACHEGHGVPRSPMLPAVQKGLCLTCHGTKGSLDQMVAGGAVSVDARPPLLATTLGLPSVHPIDNGVFSASDRLAVTCSSCHSPHRSMPADRQGPRPAGRRLPSPRDPNEAEFELCESCHGNGGATTQSRTDISRLFDPNNRSYHPVEAPARESSPSVLSPLSGREINCTDCHGNDDPAGRRGPHGSRVAPLLGFRYVKSDDAAESPDTYALCYDCHDRNRLLSGSLFPEHGEHITDVKASCSTCHNPHGSVPHRALIRFGEDTTSTGVSVSSSTGRLDFVSEEPGSGSCWLSCHGVDHGPKSYGIGAGSSRRTGIRRLFPGREGRRTAPADSLPAK